MTKQEIENKKTELRNKINEAKTEEELAELRKQAEELNKEVPETENPNNGTITHEEERELLADVSNLEQRKAEITKIIKYKEEEKVEEKRTLAQVLESPEYRTAWAKKMLGRPEKVKQALREEMKKILDIADIKLKLDTKPSVILVVGVNGVGKTTSIGKIANNLVKQGKKVVIAAADTFLPCFTRRSEEHTSELQSLV